MRRAIASLLLMLFSFSLSAPLLVAAPDSESKLPACCRRDGKHHCAMNTRKAPASGPAAQASPTRCALYPSVPSAPAYQTADSARPGFRLLALVRRPAPKLQESSQALASPLYRSWQQRGPPFQFQ